MEIKRTESGYLLSRGDETFALTSLELGVIAHFIRKDEWRCQIEERIDMEEENFSFDNISREEFVEECVTEAENKWECCFSFGEETINDIVYDKAEEYEIWEEN